MRKMKTLGFKAVGVDGKIVIVKVIENEYV
jgi:hypothetical protein